MKKRLIFLLLVFLIILQSSIIGCAQTNAKWGLKIGLETSKSSGSAININAYRLYNNWQLGAGMFVWYDYDEFSSTQSYTRKTEIGINLSARYTILKLNNVRPYLFVIAGYGIRDFVWRYSSNWYDDSYSRHPLLIGSLGLGTEINLDDSSWSVDISLGYSGYWAYVSDKLEDRPTVSVGLLKRFVAK